MAEAGVTIIAEGRPCPADCLLTETEAYRQIGLHRTAPVTCRAVAALALHEGPVPFTQIDLAERIGYSVAMVSKAAQVLYYTGVTSQGRLRRDGSRTNAMTIMPGPEFNERVAAVPAWQAELDFQRGENELDALSAEIGDTRYGTLLTVIAFYREHHPPHNQPVS